MYIYCALLVCPFRRIANCTITLLLPMQFCWLVYWPWGWWPSQHISSFVGFMNVYGILHFGCRWWHPVLSCALKTTTRHGYGVRSVHFGFDRAPNSQTAPTEGDPKTTAAAKCWLSSTDHGEIATPSFLFRYTPRSIPRFSSQFFIERDDGCCLKNVCTLMRRHRDNRGHIM